MLRDLPGRVSREHRLARPKLRLAGLQGVVRSRGTPRPKVALFLTTLVSNSCQVSPLADGRLGSAEQEARQALGEAAARAVEASGVAWPPPLEPLEGEPSGGGAAALLEGGGKELKAALKAALRAQGGAGGKAVAHERELWALDALVVVPLRQALREAFAPAGGGAAAAAAAAALGRPELLFALARQFETEQGAAFAEALASLAPKGEAELSVASARGAVRCAVARAAAWHLREHTVGALAAAAAENGGGAAAAAADAWRRTLREALVLEKQLSVPPGAASISFASPVALEPLALAEAGAVLANAGGAARLEPSALKDSLGALIADFERAPEEVTFGVIRLAGAEVARQHLFELDMRLKEQEAMGLATTAELEAGGSVACDAFAVHRAFEDLGTALGLDPADETLPEEGMSPAEACAASLQATSRRYSALSEVAAAAVGAALARGAFGRLRRPAAAGVWLASQLRALRERCSAIAPEAFAAVWRCAAVDCAALLRGGRPRKDADARREALLDAFHEVTRRPERYMRCD